MKVLKSQNCLKQRTNSKEFKKAKSLHILCVDYFFFPQRPSPRKIRNGEIQTPNWLDKCQVPGGTHCAQWANNRAMLPGT